MRKLIVPIAACVASAIIAAGTAYSQETSGTIQGIVTDQTGGVLNGVAITITNLATGQVREVQTNRQGHYVAALPVGEYDLGFRLDGFRPLTFRRVAVHVNDRVALPATLIVGVAAAVDVPAEALLQRTSATQTLLRPSDLQRLPLLNRHFAQLLPLVPGVSSDLPDELFFCLKDDLFISINGARRSAVNWLLDGASNVDVGTNATLLAIASMDAIEEIKVITSNATAEWARSGGGVVAVVTKSGTSRFSGTAYEFLRHDELNASPVSLVPPSMVPPEDGEDSEPPVKPRLRYNNFGVTLGGPALPSRKKLFFFFSAEWRRSSRDSVTATFDVPDPNWLTDPSSPNYVPPADREPSALKLLALWPKASVPGQNRFEATFPMPNDTHQQVVRLDHEIKPGWTWTARLTRDHNHYLEPWGYRGSPSFVLLDAATNVDVTGTVGVVQTQVSRGRWWNELSYAFAERRLETTNTRASELTRDASGVSIPELFPSNRANLVPNIDVSGLARLYSSQPFDIDYGNHSLTDHFTFVRGSHTLKMGVLVTFEHRTDASEQGPTNGSFIFLARDGFSAFQNFLKGNASFYFEDDVDLTNDLRFGRYETYFQDTWNRRRFSLDVGLRYSIYTPIEDAQGRLTRFSPEAFSTDRRDPLNGVVVAGPTGGALYRTDANNVQPRVGGSWDLFGDGNSIARAAYGVYFDQPQAGIFRSPALDQALVRQIRMLNTRLSDPTQGERTQPLSTTPLTRTAVSETFTTPRSEQWSAGLQRRLYARGFVDVSYVGARGDHLIRPIDLNQRPLVGPDGGDAPVPYAGQSAIIMRESIGKRRYHGLLTTFHHDGGAAGSVVVNYTLSRNQADASEDDNYGLDRPQDPLDLSGDFGDARTDRRHIFTAYYSYELPFFRDSSSRLWRGFAAGWQITGVTTITSGPAARIYALSFGQQRVSIIRPDQTGDPRAGDQGGLMWFDTTAFRPAPSGNYGTAPVAPFRLPGRHQWDLSVSKNVSLGATRHLQFRADFINAFNQTQFIQVNTLCAGNTSCSESSPGFGRVMSAHAPRQIQLGIRASW